MLESFKLKVYFFLVIRVLYYCTVEMFLDTLFPTNLGLKRAENRTFRMKEYKFSSLSFQCFNKVKYNLQNLVVFHATGP